MGSPKATVADATTSTTGQSPEAIPAGTVLRVSDSGLELEQPLVLSNELDSAPYEIEFSDLGGGTPTNEALASGSIDVAILDDTSAVQSAARGLKLKIIGYKQFAGPRITLIARPGSGVESLADLPGHRVAFTSGTTTHGLVLRALDQAGLTESDIDAVDLPQGEVFGALTADQVDAAVLYEFYRGGYIAEHTGAVELLRGDDVDPSLSFTLVAATDEALADPGKAAAIDDFLARLTRSSLWAYANAEEFTKGYYVDIYQLPAESAAAYFEAQGPGAWLPIAPSLQEVQQEQADLLFEAGYLPDAVDVGAQFDSDIIERVNGIVEEATAAFNAANPGATPPPDFS